MDFDISVLTLNLFLRPPGIHTNDSDFKDLRTQLFTQMCMPRYDIICLQEVFSTLNTRRDYIKTEALKQGFKYSYESPSPNPFYGHFTDSGLLILSRFPIKASDFITYTESTGPDRLSSKGAIYTKLKIKGTYLHVFTTHMQSSYLTDDYSQFLRYRIIRRNQLAQLKSFIDKKLGFVYEPAIIAGDFNIDGKEAIKPQRYKFACQDDYNHFYKILSADGHEELCDVIRSKYNRSLATYGIVDEMGNPTEKVITAEEDATMDGCLDYIFVMNYKRVAIDLDGTGVEPFYVTGQPVTQISDHAGVQCRIKILLQA